jgi:hypothetical protein
MLTWLDFRWKKGMGELIAAVVTQPHG